MEIAWFGHSTVRLFTFGETVVVDPIRSNGRLQGTYSPDGEPKATVILVTSDKADHCEPETVRVAAESRCRIIAPRACIKPLLRARRVDAQYAIAKKDEVLAVSPHVKVRCLATPEGFDPGIVYVVEGSETVVFLGDCLMDPTAWAYQADGIKPNVVLFPADIALKTPVRAKAFREWLGGLGSVSCIPIHYHASPHGDPVYRIDPDAIAGVLPKTARLEMLTNRPLVAKNTKRMRRRI
jgi:L-ascorbate metabolism protein UlaG (beta-lactamase superfamily)